jgi:hypothetical protein
MILIRSSQQSVGQYAEISHNKSFPMVGNQLAISQQHARALAASYGKRLKDHLTSDF